MSKTQSRLVLVSTSGSEATGRDYDLSDDELMLLARGGRREAFDLLIVRHQARMLRVATRFLGDESAAADAVQNTCVELFGALTRYTACGKFRSYLYRILLNQCRAVRRRARTESRAISLIATFQMRTESEALNRELQRDVERGLSKLTAKHREVLVLRYAADLSYQEIADAVVIPVGTVKSRITEGMARLRDVLTENS